MWTADGAESWNLTVPRRQTSSELGFLIWIFERFGDGRVHRILDLGCGTGRLAIELAARGYSVTGIDKFHTMLEKARQNAKQRHLRIDFVKTPLDELRVAGEFDAAYSIQDPFNYVLTEEELSKALSRLRSSLRPNGLLVIDMMNFASLYGRWKRVITRQYKGKNWSVRENVKHTVDDVNMLWYHEEKSEMKLNGKTRRWNETHVLRMWTYPEFRRHLAANGFYDIRLFGGLNAGAKEAKRTARRLVIVARRLPTA